MSEQYIRFRETNNWERERWRFYIPLRGNERAIRHPGRRPQAAQAVEGVLRGRTPAVRHPADADIG